MRAVEAVQTDQVRIASPLLCNVGLSQLLCRIPSTLIGPGPDVARYKQEEQNRIAAVPLLSGGGRTGSAGFLNMCPRKEAKAIPPDRTKSAIRENRPTIRSAPSASSSAPAV